MNEIITVGSEKYTVTNVTTGLNSISFMLLDLTENETKAAFKNAKSLTVGDEKNSYGEYPDVEFVSITIGADESVTVTMRILTKTEKQIKELQMSVSEHDEVIAAMMFGGEV